VILATAGDADGMIQTAQAIVGCQIPLTIVYPNAH
jgi:hypothetical protein